MNFLPDDYVVPEIDDDFYGIRTHSRYTLNISKLIEGNQLKFNLRRPSEYGTLHDEQKILRKLDIVRYTLDSIKTENAFSIEDREFLPLAVSWLWIKGYYAVFHLISLLISFENNDSRYMTVRKYNDHQNILSILNKLVATERPFSSDHMNDNYKGIELNEFKTSDHPNLKNLTEFNEELFKLSLKKTYLDLRTKQLMGLRGIKRKQRLDAVNSRTFSVFNLFLFYRELFNYSGFRYLDCEGVLYIFIELDKFYRTSYSIISCVSSSLIDYLISKTTGNINTKLLAIQQVL